MEKLTFTQSFIKGMNTDVDASALPKGSYRLAKNLTFTSIGEGTSGALGNVKGNKYLLGMSIFATFDHEVVGYVNIVKDIVFFTYKASSNESAIWVYSHSTKHTTLFYSDVCTEDGSKLSFSTDKDKRITGVGRQESDSIRKVYWVDGYNETRFIDLTKTYLVDPKAVYDCTNNPYTSADKFSLLPTVNLGRIYVDEDSVIEGGNLKAGSVQYAYRLFNKYGTETLFSSTTKVLKLTKDFPTGITYFKGENIEEDVNKSVKVYLEDIDLDFEYISIFRIFYNSYFNLPIIDKVAELEINESIFEIIDTGHSYGRIPLEEFNNIGGKIFSASSLASKNNYLFAADIKEDYFVADIDMRAYRFTGVVNPTDPDPYAEIYSSDGTEKITVNANNTWEDSSGTVHNDWGTIPIEFDSVNMHNDIYNRPYSSNPVENMFYQSNGTYIGGSGKYITYKIIKKKGTKIQDRNYSFNGKDVIINYNFKINEIYRFGIVFFDKKGRQSFVNWIGDILIPYMDHNYPVGGSTQLNSYFICEGSGLSTASTSRINTSIEFTLKVDSLKNDIDLTNIVGFKIVYAERMFYDKTVEASCFNNGLFLESNDIIKPTNNSYNGTDNTYNFSNIYSTEFTLGNYKNVLDNFKLFRTIRFTSMYGTFSLTSPKSAYTTRFPKNSLVLYSPSESAFTISESFKVGMEELDSAGTPFTGSYTPSGGTLVTSDFTFSNRFVSIEPNNFTIQYENYSPISFFISTDGPLSEDTQTGMYYLNIYDIINDNFLSKYNGISYTQRLNTVYIPASEYVKLDTSLTTIRVESFGDTFIFLYQQMISMWDEDNGYSVVGVELDTVPLESNINFNFANNKPLPYSRNNVFAPTNMCVMEEAVEGIARWPDAYPADLGDLYTYNNAYSVPAYGLYPKYTPKPLLFEPTQKNEVLVLASEKKTNSELVDNWTKFKYANILEVDSSYGAITELKALDNKLFFWQEKAFGMLAVNDRALIKSNDGSQLSLGTGGILERYDYISTNIGSTGKYNVVNSENALFWVDTRDNRIYMFSDQLRELSTVHSVDEYLKLKAPIINPISIVDFKNHETLFKINNEVLVYSWLSNSFIGIYTFNPSWFISLYDGNYASIPTTANTVWEHNALYDEDDNLINHATFYNVGNDSYIHFIVNEAFTSTKVFDNINWLSTSLNSDGVNMYEDTFKQIRCYTDYQNTGWVDLVLKTSDSVKDFNTARKERSFHTPVPRDAVNQPQSSNVNIFSESEWNKSAKYKSRMRDKLMHVEFKYDNSKGNKFFFPYVNVNYRQSFR